MRRKVIIILMILVVIILAATAVLYAYVQTLNTINSEDSYLIIKSESTVEDVTSLLKKRTIIKSEKIFLIYAKLKGLDSNISGSRLIIKPNTSYKDLISRLQTAQSDFAVVTIPEGYSLYQIAERLEKNISIKKENFLELGIGELTSNDMISKRKNTYYDLEGFLYPDTYYIPPGFTEKDTANLMFNRFKSIFSDKYMNRAKELGLSINEVITIASLIEKEAANDTERSTIAGVIYNRIKKGMLLQIDASTIYAVTKGKNSVARLTYNDLKAQDVYNTYVFKGLPPGPIASPGKPSIEAALYPESHEFLYYVLGEKGHVFSKTYEEHLNNVKKYIK